MTDIPTHLLLLILLQRGAGGSGHSSLPQAAPGYPGGSMQAPVVGTEVADDDEDADEMQMMLAACGVDRPR